MLDMLDIRSVLDEVVAVVEQRRSCYGDAREMLEEIGRRWQCPPTEVAQRMADMKLARLRHRWFRDSAIDAIAYLAMAAVLQSAAAPSDDTAGEAGRG